MKKLMIALAASALFAFTASAQELDMVDIPGKDFKMLKTEVTQELYESIMGDNPSKFKGANNPVESVSWYDAICFCNKLSVKKGLNPVYAVDGETDVAKWNYTPHKEEKLEGKVTRDENTNGFRLPTKEEWQYSAKGGKDYKYSGSNNLDEVGWYETNSNSMTHEVAKKKPNGYGLYDMGGNVWEWCWDSGSRDYRHICGGSWDGSGSNCEVDSGSYGSAYYQYYYLGFRIVCKAE